MIQPTLSVCIPTFNRSSYLRSALRCLTEPNPFPFAIEIVVSDNASDDDTGQMVGSLAAAGAPIVYARHPRNIGAAANMFSALRRASGEFAIYLADDDRLLPESLAVAVAWLQDHPSVVALHGPLQTYDAVTDKIEGVSFILPGDREFDTRDRLALLDMLLANQLIPEVPVVRTRPLGNCLFLSKSIYWAYTLTDRLLDNGAIRFTNQAYYRSVRRHSEGDDRSTVQTRYSLADWDGVRRGLEYFFWRARVTAPKSALPAATAADFERRIAEQGRHFLANALGGRLSCGAYAEASEIAKLLAAQDATPYGPSVRTTMSLFAAADLTLEIFDQCGGLAGLATVGFPSTPAIAALFHGRRPGFRVEMLDALDAVQAKQGFLVLAIDQAQREALIEDGHAPGRVIDFAGLINIVSLPEAASTTDTRTREQ